MVQKERDDGNNEDATVKSTKDQESEEVVQNEIVHHKIAWLAKSFKLDYSFHKKYWRIPQSTDTCKFVIEATARSEKTKANAKKPGSTQGSQL